MKTWWIDKPRLLGSKNPSNTELKKLRDDGFEVIISLLNVKQQAPRYNISYAISTGYERYKFEVCDFYPPLVEQLAQFVKLVDELPPETKIVVHCEGDNGRTGTFAAAYWIAKGMTATEAIAHVRKENSDAIETDRQIEDLNEFEGYVKLVNRP
jgi:protein-tyrosine phosphatase